MGVNSWPRTVTRQRCGCDLNPGLSAPESSTLTTRLPSHQKNFAIAKKSHVIDSSSDFYRAMLCMRGNSHGLVSVSVSVSVCHMSVLY